MDLELLRIVDSGTFGTVSLAWDRPGWRIVALKVLRERFVAHTQVLTRLTDEARLLQRLDHPNIVQVEAHFLRQERPVLLMEWVRGVAVCDLLPETGGLPVAVALEIVRATSEALHNAWTAEWRGAPLRVIHRDIKSNNLLLDVQGVTKVVDFGLARTDLEDRESETLSMVLGARPYLAPERLDGSDDRPNGDTYALGFVLFELLTGQLLQLSLHPLHHRQALGQWLHLLEGPDDLTADLASLLRGMCAYLPDDRPSHGEVVQCIAGLQKRYGLSRDLSSFAQRNVLPALQAQGRPSRDSDADWDDLATLFPAPQYTPDDRLRSILSVPQWHTARDFIEDLLLALPGWTAAPFLELLRPASRFRRKQTQPPEVMRACLSYAARRMNPSVRECAERLKTHADPHVARLAQDILERS